MSDAPALHTTKFVPNPIQKRFIESRAKADLWAARMGEGKSVGLAWAAFYHTRHNPGARWVIIRDTWENLRSTTMKTFFDWFPPGIFGTFNHSRKTFTWASGVAEGEVEFLGMDDPQDASKLMSRELGGFGIDEPAPAVGSAGVDEMIFDIAMTRLRQGGMSWYGAKLAENNPDESHWTYRKFVAPGTEGYRMWQSDLAENEANLPPSYYAEMRQTLAHRPDLVRRFVEGEFGFQQEGKAVTPQWSDRLHLAVGLAPVKGTGLHLLWDFGHNPTCIVTQKTPLGAWLILDALVGDGIGVEELIAGGVKPLLIDRYGFRPGGTKTALRHIGDPAGNQREQTSIHRSAVRLILKELGGSWRSGPVKTAERVEPLRAVLTKGFEGRGLMRVDRDRASAVHQALRGGWHYHVSRAGITSSEPVKNIHSHPGDAIAYGAAILFPMGRLLQKGKLTAPSEASYFGDGPDPFTKRPSGFFTNSQPGLVIPNHGDPL